MTLVGLHVALPAELVRAIDGEARRLLLRRSEVMERALRLGLVGGLAEDLLYPVLDVEAEPEPQGELVQPPHAKPPSAFTEGAPNEPCSQVVPAIVAADGQPQPDGGDACAP